MHHWNRKKDPTKKNLSKPKKVINSEYNMPYESFKGVRLIYIWAARVAYSSYCLWSIFFFIKSYINNFTESVFFFLDNFLLHIILSKQFLTMI